MAIVYGQNYQQGSYRTPSVSDTSNLVWNQRSNLKQVYDAGGNSMYTQIFYAIAANTLTNDQVTLQWNQAPTLWGVIDVFAVSGANTAAPFDTNSALPNFPAVGAYPSVTTSSANDFVYGLENTASTSAPTTGSGWSAITSGVSNSYTASEYKIVSSPQSALGVLDGLP
jgi:hypothetical protein